MVVGLPSDINNNNVFIVHLCLYRFSKMGSMLRSDKMALCDIYLQPEAAFEILSQLGEVGCVQFLDVSSEQNNFRNY